MRKLVFLLIIFNVANHCLIFADPKMIFFKDNFPKNTEIETIKKWVEEFPQEVVTEDLFVYIFENNKLDYLLPLIKTFHDNFPGKYTPAWITTWTNPITLAMIKEQEDLAIQISDIAPDLILKPDASYKDGHSPIINAISMNKVMLVKHFFKLIPDLANKVRYPDYVINNESDLTYNLITYSVAQEMDSILISNGVETIYRNIKYPDSYITDNQVNFRSEPSLTSRIFFQLSNNDKVKIKALTYKTYTINNQSGRWVNIVYNGKEGWVFSPFLYIWRP